MPAQPPAQATDLNERVAAEVRAALARFRLKQADLTEVLGVTQTQVSSRLRGQTQFTLRDVEALASYFNTTPSVLMGYEKEPEPTKPSPPHAAKDSNPDPRATTN